MLKEYFKLIEELDEDRLEKAIILALNPPVELINYYTKYFRSFNETLPPQPSIESIPIESIKKILGEDGVEIFLAVDQVVSLMPRYMLRKLNEVLTKREDLDIVRTLSRKLYDEYSKTVDGMKVKDLIFEDSRKKHILLVLPSWRQLEIVHGRWSEFAWKEKTLKNEETPTVEGWVKDVTLLADVLIDEGVKPIIVADTVHEGRLPVSRGETIYVDFGRGLCKIGYPRDSSITWFSRPIISNMALPFRRGEEEVIIEVYWRIGLTPITRLRWVESGGSLKRMKVEGGNFFMIGNDEEAALITGIGVRGTDPPPPASICEILTSIKSIFNSFSRYLFTSLLNESTTSFPLPKLSAFIIVIGLPSFLGGSSMINSNSLANSMKLFNLKFLESLSYSNIE